MNLELLSPAGDFEKLKTAVLYGADAVYLAPEGLSLRAGAGNFTPEGLKSAFSYLRARGKKGYLTLNIYPRAEDLLPMQKMAEFLPELSPDAVIVADLGVFSLIRRHAPGIPIHISTQANSVSALSAGAWYDLGAKRIILSRELSLKEIGKIRRETPEDLELEAFVHGAVCVSYSGRCLLSSYMTGRDPNRGDCAQSCRWRYALVEEKRPGEYFPLSEDGKGSYILNSRDLSMIRHIPELVSAGVTSFKIEGRAKSAYYAAAVTNAYRIALDSYQKNPQDYVFDERLQGEVKSVSHRRYGTGFYFGDPKGEGQEYENGGYLREYEVAAVVLGREGEFARCVQKNRFFAGDALEIMPPGGFSVGFIAEEIRDGEGNLIPSAPHPEMELLLKLPQEMPPGTFLRRKK